ncbi:MAG: beta-ketoacyl-[acyl-carrier-protein] synthase family protein [Bryobacteraceae bacterium]|nr:beta-ketoacyl-[acyl-carrier-protein] synthase family protein [Bryobacteraceae bacterium]MDW8377402.1 beta-ketoacyl-[acyl-carrier-protein] synthase family protein [Bryobacterales bacterium]
MNRRVVITGLGVISACGKNAAEFWDSVRQGRDGASKLEEFPGLRFSNGGRVRGYQPQLYFTERELDHFDLAAQFGVLAARQAISCSGLEFTSALRESTGVITGCCVGGKLTEDSAFRELYEEKKTRFNPMIVPRTMANAGASAISMEHGFQGACLTFSTACSSSNHALAQAFWMVRQGSLEVAIAGGHEAPFSLGHLKAWEALRVVSPDVCRPFCKERRGMILGEGGAMFVLEPLEHARARGATIYAEIVGAGMNADAHHLTQPSADGAARAIRLALQDAGVAPEAIGYANAHGTGTQANDATEAQALRMVFGRHCDRLAVSSTKSVHGHALGAAGALEAAATVLGLHHRLLPPTAHFGSPDPDCPLDVIANQARVADPEYAISNSFAFGGLNAVIVFRRW